MANNVLIVIIVTSLATYLSRFLGVISAEKIKETSKMFRWFKGTRMFENSAFSATYKTVWCAGPSLEGVHSIRNVSQVVADILEPFMHEGES